MMYFETFELTEDHIRLLNKLYVGFDDNAYDGAPAGNPKRPYGNSDVPGDVVSILNWDTGDQEDPDAELSDLTIDRALSIHRETGKALQVILSAKTFEPGMYGRPDKYNTQKWVKVKE